jgi:CRISPR-associated exonuclease Cas4
MFYAKPRRRDTIVFDGQLRGRTEGLVIELREMLDSGKVPPPRYGAHCRSCSLLEVCRPTLHGGRSAAAWIERMRLDER